MSPRTAITSPTDESGCDTVGGTCHRAGDLAQVTDAAVCHGHAGL